MTESTEESPQRLQNDSLETVVDRNLLYHLAQQQILSKEALEESLNVSQVIPNRKDWLHFLSSISLLLGITLLLCGITFFFAYNWASLHKFAKLAVAQTAILVFLVIAFARGFNHIVGKCCLLGACIMIGPALGVYGTIYQTGADAHELFSGWALLMFGWVAISNFGALWFTWLVIINVFATLYSEQMYNFEPNSMGNFYITLFFVNFTAIAAWEYFYLKKVLWLQNRFLPRLINMFVQCVLVTPTLILIFDQGQGTIQLMPVLFLLYTAGVFYFYQKYTRDLFMLTINCLALIIVASCVFGKAFITDILAVIFLSFFIMGATAMAGYWLNKVGRSWND